MNVIDLNEVVFELMRLSLIEAVKDIFSWTFGEVMQEEETDTQATQNVECGGDRAPGHTPRES